MDALQAQELHLGASQQPDSGQLLDGFRNFIYVATEAFDVYYQLIPHRLKMNATKLDKKKINSFVQICKRLRDPTALLCNKFKHGSRQLFLTSAFSPITGAGSLGYMVARYRGGDSLICDDEVHKQPERSVTFRRKLHEVVHALLRVDYNAAFLIRDIRDNSSIECLPIALTFAMGNAMDRLVGIPVYAVSNEPQMFDGLDIHNQRVTLARVRAIKLADPTRRTTTIRADGVTRSFAFA
jgi:hypothetical protein